MMTYDETLAWIHQMEQFGINLGLTRMEELLNRMGRPDRALKIIHVAGTNGKGSVCAFIASILKAAGYSVGRYISPTLVAYRERIQMNGQMIGEEKLSEGMSFVREICEAMASDGLEVPTIFEIETAVAFWYFKKQACDYVVLEVGMGGRLDSTNVIEHPVLNVLTSISMDHMAQLGDTLSAIAYEKAGIIKTGVPVVVYPQKEDAMEVIRKVCEEKQTYPVISDWNRIVIKERKLSEGNLKLEARQTFDYKDYKDCQIHLAGSYQIQNACLAIEAIEALKLDWIETTHIIKGLADAKWPGRFECLSKEPVVFIDGAHNPEGAKSLLESVQVYFPEKKVTLVMGVFKDKDFDQILKIMSDVSDTLITFTPDHPRGLASDVLALQAEKYFTYVDDGKTADQALAFAKMKNGSDGVILIFGSLSTVAAFYDLFDIKRYFI